MNARDILKQYFGYADFRLGQEETISAILSGRDALAVMPTGAGKSVCYQVPAMMMDGITIVVSPLISLMQDQVKALNKAGIRAAYINSSLTEAQIAKAISLAEQGVYKIVYAAPERLDTAAFRRFARNARIAMITVDEAHCISQWGQDFRPSYLRIVDFVRDLPYRPIVSAFTATATAAVIADIIHILQMANPSVNVTGFDRPNLYFAVKQTKKKDAFVLDYLRQHQEESGIIYCATRKNVDKLCRILQDARISAAAYHAGLSNEERTQNQNDFVYDRVSVIVATNAFGMGIDKSNVRFVIHYNMPQSMENYYQEAGRAGRDGVAAQCILLFSYQDIVINRFLLEHKEFPVDDPEQSALIRSRDEDRLQRMIHYSEGNRCLRSAILGYFGQVSEEHCGSCGNCLKDPLDYGEAENAMPARKRAGITGGAEQESALFSYLRELRKAIAQENSVPPYVIFSDATLADMCRKLPQTKEQLLGVSGVGQVKLENYGQRFIEAIQKYQAESLMQPNNPPEKKSKKVPFYLTSAEAVQFPYAEFYTAGEMRDAMNGLNQKECKKLFATEIEAVFIQHGLLTIRAVNNGGEEKYPTAAGLSAGIAAEEKVSERGTVYHILRYPLQLQKLAVAAFTR